jgi:hypothetical protein
MEIRFNFALILVIETLPYGAIVDMTAAIGSVRGLRIDWRRAVRKTGAATDRGLHLSRAARVARIGERSESRDHQSGRADLFQRAKLALPTHGPRCFTAAT